jgi:SAM-dependent methyltransferase
MVDEELDALLAEQRAYYRARAGEYDASYPLDQSADADARRRLLTELEAHAPYGRVLELACGTGQWTVELARHASAVTAVDSSPEALAICRRRVDVSHVSLLQADLFAWRPEERYDLVFFAAWLSHVPPQRFDAFWALVADCVAPAGRAFVIDELPAAVAVEQPAPGQPAPAVRRRLTTGRSYRAVKVLHEPDEVRRRLAALGWEAEVRTVGWRFFYATVRRLGAGSSSGVRTRRNAS